MNPAMTLAEALERADLLAPAAHPSGKQVLFSVAGNDPVTSRALGVLAAEVRRLKKVPPLLNVKCSDCGKPAVDSRAFPLSGKTRFCRECHVLNGYEAP